MNDAFPTLIVARDGANALDQPTGMTDQADVSVIAVADGGTATLRQEPTLRVFHGSVLPRRSHVAGSGSRRGPEQFDQLHRIPYPADAAASRIREQVDAALAERDAESLLSILMIGAVRLPASERCSVLWLPAAIGMAEMRCDGRPLFREGQIQHHIKREVRSHLAKAAYDPTPLWVVPVESTDSCAAHVAALIMTHDGRPARPWLWRMAPPSARFMTIGSRPPTADDTSIPTCGGHHVGVLDQGADGLVTVWARSRMNTTLCP